jgi:3-deoxy-7-phosphoheptulonate synthase
MLIILREGTKASEATGLVDWLSQQGVGAQLLGLAPKAVIRANLSGDEPVLAQTLAKPIVETAIEHRQSFVLSSRQVQSRDTVIDLGDGVTIGNGSLTVIAGPCSIESYEQALEVAIGVRDAGAQIMRGGLWKPRTSPFSFQGLEAAGCQIMDRVRAETGIKFVTEAVDEASLELVEAHADMIQIGSRNMQNFALLKRAARSEKPVLLKRGFAATIDDLLMAADYLLAGGNPNVAICERGIRTFCTHSRNTLDLNAVPILRQLSHLPVVVDPSHGTGRRDLVPAMSCASVAAGAQALIIEVHHQPECALSDGDQSLSIQEFAALMPKITTVANALGVQVGGLAVSR